jgi:hypothetical protein
MLLCGCAPNPLAGLSLPQLCPRTSTEVGGMAERIYGVRRDLVVAHFGAPARRSPDEDIASEKLVWGPLAILYRRDDGETVSMACEVEMYAGTDGAISRVIWTLRPPESQYQAAERQRAPVPLRVEPVPGLKSRPE